MQINMDGGDHNQYEGSVQEPNHHLNNFPIRFPIHDEKRHAYSLRYMKKEIKEQLQIDAAARAEAQQGEGLDSDKLPSIRCVPRGLFGVDLDSYSPWVLSMSPMHSSMLPVPCLMDRCKAQCVSRFMSRHRIIVSDVSVLEDYLLPHATQTFWSNLYPDLLAFDNDHLRLSFTIDTVFLHEFLLFLIDRSKQLQDSRIGYLRTFLSCDVRINEILRDLALVGNQIPMRFLRRIAQLGFRTDDSVKPDIGDKDLAYILEEFAHHACIFYNSQYSETALEEELQGLMQWAEIPRDKFLECQHLLDCIYFLCTNGEQSGVSGITSGGPCCQALVVGQCCSRNNKPTRPTKYHLPTASRLSKAGIRFKACNGNVSVIKYEKRKLELVLPRLVVYNTTDAMLRNLLAHEQSRDDNEAGKLAMYAVLMDSLIDTTHDLAILIDAKVLTNHLGSNERLVKMWNDMCVNVVLRPSMEFI